jgi:peptidoglycan/xylan/chitin deacetylase (PgdA/CDA1 family)
MLLKKGIPATFFLNSAFVDNQGLFYRYKVSLLLDNLQQNSHKTQHMLREFNLSDSADIKAHLLSLGYAHTPIIDTLAQKLGIDFEAYLRTNKPYMTKAQILAMQAKGFTFGAHSIDHPYMHLLSEADQMEQFSQSIVQLKNLLNIPIQSFAFPFTDHGVRGATIANMHKTRLIHLSFGTSGIRPDELTGHVQRFSLELNGQPARQLILKEKLKATIRTCLGTNTLKANR